VLHLGRDRGAQTGRAHLPDRRRALRHATEQRVDDWRWGADIVGAHCVDIHSIWIHRARTWRRSDVRPDHIADNLVEGLSLVDQPAVKHGLWSAIEAELAQ